MKTIQVDLTPLENVSIPSTRYVGSKQKLVNWIWENIQDLEFNSFLDLFGGTGVVGYVAKINGKKVIYNDYLKFNYIIGKALIENNKEKLTNIDINFILSKHNFNYPKFISNTFKDIYYTDEENKFLVIIIHNISLLKNEYKRALAFYCLFQSCIRKRPYNLFHRKNLYVRFAEVKRSFGNKKTWDTPFPEHLKKFVHEINSLIIDNKKENKSVNLDIFELSGNYDLVYIDTPYFSSHSNIGVDYKDFYHFLEGIVNYSKWNNIIDNKSKHKRLVRDYSIWTDKNKIYDAFDRLFSKFKDSILVVSYRSGGIPTKEQMINLLKKYKSHVRVEEKNFKYVLSHNRSSELLFVAT